MSTIRFVQIALLLCVGLAPGYAVAQSNSEIVNKIGSEWRSCVQNQIALFPVTAEEWAGPAEKAFQYCATEEQLFIAAVNLGAPTESAVKQTLFAHYRDKAAWKKKITDDFFATLLKQIGKQ